jgi:hypothetical protein
MTGLADVASQGDLTLWRHHTATALFHLGRTAEALQEVEESLRAVPSDPGGLLVSIEAMIAAAEGDERTAEDKITAAVAGSKGFGHFHHTAYAIASTYALMNRPEPALKWLQMTVDAGFPCYPLFLRDPNLDRLRHDPRFTTFMGKLKAQWAHYHAVLRP